MHCGASLSELHGALAFGLGHQMYMVVFVEECSMGIFSSWVHCAGVSNRWSGIQGGTVGWKMGWNDGCS